MKIEFTPSLKTVNNESIIGTGNIDAGGAGVYVPLAGGTMTGELILPASTSTLIPLHLQEGTTPTTPVDGDIWFDQNGMYIQNLSAIHQLDADANAVGALSNAVITLGSTTGTIDATSIEVFIYALAGWQGNYMRRTVPAATGLALTDGVANFLVVSYNAGSPIYSITTSASSVNNSNVLLVATMWRSGADIHWAVVNWGLATATRLNDRLINIQRYVRSSGLILGETTGNVITSTSGLLWYGVKAYAQGTQSSSPSNADFYYHSGGVWMHSTVSTYNNTQYDDGTNLVALGPSKFTVNWVYQFVNGDGLPKLAYYLGTASYSTVAAAAGASQPTPPTILTQMGILIGRIIVGTGAATASEIDSAFTTVFAGTAITDHNSLAGLQGGASAQYYHLTSTEYTGTGTGAFVRSNAPTFTGTVSLANGVQIKLTVPATDSYATGPSTSDFNAGYSSAVGDLCYMDSSATWQKTDANTVYSGLLGIALEAKTSGQSMLVALPGSFVYSTTFPTMVIGGPVYMSETAGAMTQSQPTTTDAAVRVIGHAVHANKIFFNPDNVYVTHT